MDVLQAIENRRSVRSFTAEKVSCKMLTTLCLAGLAAPSARNDRPWELIVIQNRETLCALADVRAPWKTLRAAPAAIAVASPDGKYMQQNCAAAAENILLCAEALGLGACWLGLYPNMDAVEAVQALLCLPEGLLPVMLIALGHPQPGAPGGGRKVEGSKIHFERFGGRV